MTPERDLGLEPALTGTKDHGVESAPFLRMSERQQIPEFSKMDGMDDFFQRLDFEVDTRWSPRASIQVENIFHRVREGITAKVDSETENLLQILNSDSFFEIARAQKMGAYTQLRIIKPELWKELMSVFIQRQEQKIELGLSWAKNDALLKGPEWAGYGLLTLMELASASRGFNADYLQYLEICKEGHDSNSSNERLGREYYHRKVVQKGEKRKVSYVPYIETYGQLANIITEIRTLRENIVLRMSAGQLPAPYEFLVDVLEATEKCYGSTSKKRREVDDLWLDLRGKTGKLLESDCPITFIAETGIGSYGEIEPGVRIGVKTEKTVLMQRRLRDYGLKDIVEGELASKYKHFYGKVVVPDTFCNFQAFAWGTNIESVTRAEQEMGFVIVHTNDYMTRFNLDRNLYKKLFPELFQEFDLLPVEEQEEIAQIVVVLHEYGHTYISNYLKKVERRLGYSEFASVVDETKADTTGVYLLSRLELTEKKRRMIYGLWFMMTVCESVFDQNSDPLTYGGSYFNSMCAMLEVLMNQDCTQAGEEHEYGLRLEEGIKVLSEYSKEILKWYTQRKYHRDQIENFGRKMSEVYRDGSPVKKLILSLRNNARIDNGTPFFKWLS